MKLTALMPVTTAQAAVQQAIKDRIINRLKASELCTWELLLEEVRVMCDLRRQNLLPQVITALAAMIDADTLCEDAQMSIDNPLESAWLVSVER